MESEKSKKKKKPKKKKDDGKIEYPKDIEYSKEEPQLTDAGHPSAMDVEDIEKIGPVSDGVYDDVILDDVPRVKGKRSGDTIIVSCPYCKRSHFYTKGLRDEGMRSADCGRGQYIIYFDDMKTTGCDPTNIGHIGFNREI